MEKLKNLLPWVDLINSKSFGKDISKNLLTVRAIWQLLRQSLLVYKLIEYRSCSYRRKMLPGMVIIDGLG